MTRRLAKYSLSGTGSKMRIENKNKSNMESEVLWPRGGVGGGDGNHPYLHPVVGLQRTQNNVVESKLY